MKTTSFLKSPPFTHEVTQVEDDVLVRFDTPGVNKEGMKVYVDDFDQGSGSGILNFYVETKLHRPDGSEQVRVLRCRIHLVVKKKPKHGKKITEVIECKFDDGFFTMIIPNVTYKMMYTPNATFRIVCLSLAILMLLIGVFICVFCYGWVAYFGLVVCLVLGFCFCFFA